jgi:hypothetical protein
MNTQLFKNALLNMSHKEQAVQDLIRYWKEKHADNPIAIALMEEFGREYCPEKAIWWYMQEPLSYQVVN